MTITLPFLTTSLRSWHGTVFRVTGSLWGEFAGQWWVPHKEPVMRRFDVLVDVNRDRLQENNGVASDLRHLDADVTWPGDCNVFFGFFFHPFLPRWRRRHRFSDNNLIYSIEKFWIWIFCEVSIGLNHGLAPNRRHAIFWINDGWIPQTFMCHWANDAWMVSFWNVFPWMKMIVLWCKSLICVHQSQTDNRSLVVQVMAWCRWATSRYLTKLLTRSIMWCRKMHNNKITVFKCR